jgi:bacillithiol biosynthesis cysteine-adding enzyme BshC
MHISRIPFRAISQLSKIDVAFAEGDPRLTPFQEWPVSLEAFADVIAKRQQFPCDRIALRETLRRQYENLPSIPAVDKQIELLADARTFTVITAHQPCLLTGPLYYIYKIFSTIHLAALLREAYPAYHFVPVFVSGAEDHDFEEVQNAHLFHKTLRWEYNGKGPVGQIPTDSLASTLNSLREMLGAEGSALFQQIETAYTSHPTYGASALHLIHSFLGDRGLVVADMNAPAWKRLFIPAMERELFEQASQQIVEQAQHRLAELGFGPQAHARPVNLFYMTAEMRERIVFESGRFKVLNSDLEWSPEAMRDFLHQHPERFSPNVVLRPLYQETIMPNLAYIGGGGEIAYWLERKEQFAYFGVPFPMLIRRNSVWWIDEAGAKRMKKLGLSAEALLEDTDVLVNRYVAAHANQELSLAGARNLLLHAYAQILEKATAIDPTLEKAVLAEQAKQLNALDHLETKLLRAEKQRQDTSVQQIRALKDKYFPGNGLQERHDNFLPLYLKYGRQFFDLLEKNLNPLEPGFLIVEG